MKGSCKADLLPSIFYLLTLNTLLPATLHFPFALGVGAWVGEGNRTSLSENGEVGG